MSQGIPRKPTIRGGSIIVVGSSKDTGEQIETFASSVFEALLISSTHV